MLKSRIFEISDLKDKHEIELKNYFPYGVELVSEEFYSILTEIFPPEIINPFFYDKELFQYRDLLNESYIRRAARTISGIIHARY